MVAGIPFWVSHCFLDVGKWNVVLKKDNIWINKLISLVYLKSVVKGRGNTTIQGAEILIMQINLIYKLKLTLILKHILLIWLYCSMDVLLLYCHYSMNCVAFIKCTYILKNVIYYLTVSCLPTNNCARQCQLIKLEVLYHHRMWLSIILILQW